MDAINWAKNEVDIAIKMQNPDNDLDNKYYEECLKSALKAFKSLCKDGHSGYSIQLTRNILNDLIDQKPLTPITEEDFFIKDNSKITANPDYLKEHDMKNEIQCPRMSSLFRTEYNNGTVTYTDVGRIQFYTDGADYPCSCGVINNFINKEYPIKFPYSGEIIKAFGKYKYIETENGNNYDEYFLEYIILPDGTRHIYNHAWRIEDK